jgi:hypothetical protein
MGPRQLNFQRLYAQYQRRFHLAARRLRQRGAVEQVRCPRQRGGALSGAQRVLSDGRLGAEALVDECGTLLPEWGR